MGKIASERVKLKAKRTFIKKGTCSRTFFYILDHEFGHPRDEEEKAIDPLAGGILQEGYQCGMLWGASMAVGAEALRKIENTKTSSNVISAIKKAFYEETDYEMQCNKICGQQFNSLEEHTEFIKKGGCKKLIGVLADTS